MPIDIRPFFFIKFEHKDCEDWGKYNWTWTCGVGEGGAASTGDRAEALLANLHKATAPSSCCLELDELRRLISNSRPIWKNA